MFRLVLDTSTDYYYLSLLKDNIVLNEYYEKGFSNHSETIIPKLEETLKINNIVLKDISEIYIGIGPGSYTGVRVSTVIGKMIGVMNASKIYTFSSLALIASGSDTESYPMIDCRRGNAYISHFSYIDNKLTRLMDDSVLSIEEFFKDKDISLKLESISKPNVLSLIESSEVKLIDDIDSITPNYLQITEAERNKNNGNIKA